MSGTASAKTGRHGLARPRRTPRGVLGRSALVLGLVALGQLVLLPGTAHAAGTSFAVTTTADIATTAGACGNSSITTAPSPLSLREATCLANNLGGTVTINIPAGTYNLPNGELTLGTTSGQNVTIAGAGSAATIIDGNSVGRIFNIDPAPVGGVTASISGVTITHGKVTSVGGGGILDGSVNGATADVLNISNSVISYNTATGTGSPGGGLQMWGGQLNLTNTTVDHNTSNIDGSGIYYQATGTASPEGLNVSASSITNNDTSNISTSGFSGGAIFATGISGSTFSVTGDSFTGNTTNSNGALQGVGAAIYAETGTLTADRNTFSGNSVTGTGSSGSAVYDTGTASMHYNRITGNTGTGTIVTTTSLDAGDNWWGCNTGPNTSGCDTTSGTVNNSTSYLKLVATASPSHVVGPNGTATITASLTTDSLGATVGGSNLGAFDTLPVTFGDPPGDATVAASTAALSSGQASVGYNSHTTLGPDNDTVSLDHATVSAVIEVDEAPAITSANAANFNIGTSGSFTVTTTGYPSATLTESGSLPTGLTFADQGNGTATISGTASGAGGSYPITVTANNGYSPNATQTLTVTVGQPPAFTSGSTATFQIGTSGSFTVTTSGVPTVSTITESGTLPAGVTFSDNHNGTATISGTPTGTGSTYPVTLTATNGVSPDATQSLSIQVNQAPAVTLNPSDQTVQPGTSVSFSAGASGVPTPTVQWQHSTVGGASFSNISGATSTTYTFTAVLGDDGSQYRAVFTNAAGTATTTAATLSVGTAPAFTSADHTTFVVGQAGSFTITTSGAPSATLSETGAPAWLTLSDNGNGTGAITGTPPAASGGTYVFTLKAANGFSPSASQTFTLEVDEAPTFTSADHTTFTRGVANTFGVTTNAGYPTATTLSATGVPSGLTFSDNGDGTATLSGNPGAGTSGPHTLTITATATGDPAAKATQSFTLTIDEAPTFTSADHTTFSAGTSGSFTVATSTSAYPASTTVSVTGGTLPSGVTFTPSGTGGTIAGTPNAGSGGVYTITLKASNGVSPDTTQTFTLTVNEPAHITSANHATFVKGVADAFTVTTAGGQPSSITITESGSLPAGVSFTDNGDGTATLGGTPTAGGSFPITITASNGVLPNATQSFTLTVDAAPAITSLDHTTFAVGSAGGFTVTTTPGNPSDVALAVSAGTLPSGVTFHDNGDGTATLAGTPAVGSGNSYSLTITASNSAHLSSSQPFTLTVTELPAFTSADHTTFSVGANGTFTVHTTAGYPAATALTETGALPGTVSFHDNGDGTATLSGTPTAGGSYPITLTATNSVGHTDQSFTLTVTDTPVITSADHTTFGVGAPGSFTVTSTPGTPADTTLAVSGDTLPSGVSFHDNGDGTATLAGTPAAGTGKTYALTVTASNSANLSSTQAFTLTVTDVPVVTSADHATFTVGTNGGFAVQTTAGYPAATTLAETGALPSGISFHDNGDGTATLAGTPATGTGGSYPITLTATNSVGHTEQAFTLTVTESSSFTSADHATFDAGHPGTFTVTTTGGYPVHPALTESGALPSGVTFHDNGNGTATLAGTPVSGGVYPITIMADNGGSPAAMTTATTATMAGATTASQAFTLTVTGPPAITSPDRATFYEGIAGSFTVTTRPGVPAGPVTLTESGALPRGLSFHDNGDGTATLAGRAIGDSMGTYRLTIAASNGTSTAATQTFTLTVTHAGAAGLPAQQPPSSGTLQGLPQHTQPGQQVTVSGGGYAPNAPITLAFYPSRAALAHASAATDGTFSATFRLPTVTGTQTMVAAGIGADGRPRYLEAGTVVEAASAASGVSTPVSGSGALATTGPAIDVRRAAGYALAAMFAGLGLVAAGRRRKQA